MEFETLEREFYLPSAAVVARRLLGHWLLRQTADGGCGGAIVEVEAYLTGDPASHGFIGLTERNKVMYGPPGYAYVYFIYGAHYCVNAVCGPSGRAEGVLIRAVEAEFGAELMRGKRRAATDAALTNGPGKLCAAMGIGGALDGADLCDAASPLVIARNPQRGRFVRMRGPIVATRRIGITRAAELPLRFCLEGSSFVSRRKD